MLLTGAVGLTASLRTVAACTDEHPASLALSLDEPLILSGAVPGGTTWQEFRDPGVVIGAADGSGTLRADS